MAAGMGNTVPQGRTITDILIGEAPAMIMTHVAHTVRRTDITAMSRSSSKGRPLIIDRTVSGRGMEAPTIAGMPEIAGPRNNIPVQVKDGITTIAGNRVEGTRLTVIPRTATARCLSHAAAPPTLSMGLRRVINQDDDIQYSENFARLTEEEMWNQNDYQIKEGRRKEKKNDCKQQ